MGRAGLRLRLAAVAVGIILAPFLRFTSFFATQSDRAQALALATTLHQRMAEGDIDGIYNDADQGMKSNATLDHHRALFSAISRKLGTPIDCVQGTTEVKFGLFSKKIRTRCTTRFSQSSTAAETLVWAKSDDQYRLYYYYIQSDDLVNR